MTEDKRLKQLRELGLTISYYRKLKGLTQGQLASLVGLSRTHISNIEAPNIKTSISPDSSLILQGLFQGHSQDNPQVLNAVVAVYLQISFHSQFDVETSVNA